MLIDFDKIYVGELPDEQKHGMAQAYSLELPNSDREQSNIISDLSFYYIEEGKLVQKGTGAFNLDDPEQKANFDFISVRTAKWSRPPKLRRLLSRN